MAHLMAMALSAVITGAQSFVAIAEWAADATQPHRWGSAFGLAPTAVLGPIRAAAPRRAVGCAA